MRSSIKAGTLLGIPLFIHWSILLAVGGAVYRLGVTGLVLTVLAYASVVVHEYAHALAGRRYKFTTSDILLHYFGGVAKINMNDATPKQEAVVAAAGPAASLLIAAVAFLADAILFNFADGKLMISGMTLATMLGIVNVVIAVFNLIPIFPMDGGRILRSVLQRWFSKARATEISLNVSVALSATMLVAAIVKLHSLILIAGILLAVSIALKYYQVKEGEAFSE